VRVKGEREKRRGIVRVKGENRDGEEETFSERERDCEKDRGIQRWS